MRFEMQDGTFRCGGAFTLRDPSTETEATYFDGWRVAISKGSKVVVATGGRASGYEEALRTSLAKAYEGLDAFSVQGLVDLDLREPLDVHVVWWPDEKARSHVAVVEGSELKLHVGRPTAVVTEASGQGRLPTPAPTPAPHPSFRFFRRAQVTDDLFDAYRNAFLALESILSDIVPRLVGQDGRLEGEKKWLLRALQSVHTSGRIDLNTLLPSSSTNPARRLIKQLWTQVRTALFHAKKGAPALSSMDAADRSTVIEALRTLRKLYLALVQAHLGLTRSSSGVSPGFIMGNIKAMLDQTKCYATDDSTPFDPDQSVPNPAGGYLVEMVVTQIARIDPWVVELRAQAEAPQIDQLTSIASILLTKTDANEPLQTIMPDGRLLIDGIEVLEARIRTRGSNHAQLKERFAS